MCFLATKVSWQEPLLFKTSGSQTDPLSPECFVVHHSKTAPQEPRTPQRRDWEWPLGPGRAQVVSGARAIMGEGALRATCRFEGNLALAMQGLLPSPKEARKGWGQGLQVLPPPNQALIISAIRTNPQLSLGGALGTRDLASGLGFRHLWGTPSQHP